MSNKCRCYDKITNNPATKDVKRNVKPTANKLLASKRQVTSFRRPVLTVLCLIFLGNSACMPTQLRDWISPPTVERRTVTLQVAAWSSGEPADALLQTLLDEYTSSFEVSNVSGAVDTNVEIELNILPQYGRSIGQLLQSESPPDIFLVDTFSLPELVDSEDVLAFGGAEASLPAATVASVFPELLEAFTVNGSLYCLPREFTTLAVIYNKQHFDDAGIAYPDESWNWTSLSDAARLLTETTNPFYSTFGLALEADVSRWLPFLVQAGGKIVDEQQREMTIDSTAGIQSLEFYLGLLTEGYAVEPSSLSTAWSGEAFGIDRIGMVIEGSWVLPYLEQEFPALSYGVAPLPSGPAGKATTLFANCYAVHPRSQNRAEALDLLAYLGSNAVQQRWQSESTYFPARLSLADDVQSATPEAEVYYSQLEDAVAWRLPSGFEALVDAVNSSMQQVIDAEVDVLEVARVGRVIGTEILDK